MKIVAEMAIFRLLSHLNKMEIEKYIAATLNGEREFQQKWKFFLTS